MYPVYEQECMSKHMNKPSLTSSASGEGFRKGRMGMLFKFIFRDSFKGSHSVTNDMGRQVAFRF